MSMHDCPCGKPVRLRAQKIAVSRRRGVAHWIEHMDGSPMHEEGWACSMLKPYPRESGAPYTHLMARWEQHAATYEPATGPAGEQEVQAIAASATRRALLVEADEATDGIPPTSAIDLQSWQAYARDLIARLASALREQEGRP